MTKNNEIIPIFVRACDKLEQFKASFGALAPENLSKGNLEARKKRCEQMWQEIDKAYGPISDPAHKLEPSDIEPLITKYTNIQDSYFDLIGSIVDLLDKLLRADTSSRSENTQSGYNHIKLPAIDIPKFNGDYTAWASFRDLFKAVIHENPNLTPVTKLWYLKGKLTGEGEVPIKNFTVTAANYEPAWAALNDRFENKRVLVNYQLKRLFSIPASKDESAIAIRSIYDTVSESLAAISNLGVLTLNWDPILVYLVTQKMPSESHKLWEQSLQSSTNLPKWEDFKRFLSARFRTLEAVDEAKPTVVPRSNQPNSNQNNKGSKTIIQSFHAQPEKRCKVCNSGQHSINKCFEFLNMDVSKRRSIVKSKNCCYNCLNPTHHITKCSSNKSCSHCGKRHHSLLHIGESQTTSASTISATMPANSSSVVLTSENDSGSTNSLNQQHLSVNSNFAAQGAGVLLATALIKVKTKLGNYTLRCLIDPGSEASFLLESTLPKIQPLTRKIAAKISGMGNVETASASRVANLTLLPRDKYNSSVTIETIVLKKLTAFLPSYSSDPVIPSEFEGLELADPHFYDSGRIELVLGADCYAMILQNGVLKNKSNSMVAQNTIFGYIISGKQSENSIIPSTIISSFNGISLDDEIRKFWEMEEVPVRKLLSPEEEYCESHFNSTHARRSDGRYVVDLPFVADYPTKVSLGASREIALRRFGCLERKLNKDLKLKRLYDETINEHLKLGHMTLVESKELVTDFKGKEIFSSSYLPHHGVLKLHSTSTKLRVVFDASCASANGVSLNEVLCVGPTLHQDLTAIILRFRKYPIVINADICKMYLQILLNNKHAEFQRILYRKSSHEPIIDYKLTTVTFGVTCAPYLAMRILRQLAIDEGDKFRHARRIIQEDFFVDDLLTGGFSVEEVKEIQQEIIEILRLAKFELKKFTSNCPEVLNDIPSENRLHSEFLAFNHESVPKTLGVLWNNVQDIFTFRVDFPDIAPPYTKRKIFSQIAKIFDPAGWLTPVVITAKILMQDIWKDGTQWDEEILKCRVMQWQIFFKELAHIESIKISRWLNFHPQRHAEIHAFCDASIKAYAAVVYIRVIEQDGLVHTALITSKSKVAPIKTISLPRLELCGAVLLSRLVRFVKNSLGLPPILYYAWTDSTIVLTWLRGPACRFKTFVANRVTEILENVDNTRFQHVASGENPADIATRGIKPSDLVSNNLWFHGPKWLQTNKQFCSDIETFKVDKSLLEERPIKVFATSLQYSEEICGRFSCLHRALRVLSYCRRFISNARRLGTNFPPYIKLVEIQRTKVMLIRSIQQHFFAEEYACLEDKKNLSKDSSILRLNPFLDNEVLLRINCRLSNLSVTFSEKHTLILPYQSNFTKLVIKSTHQLTCHGELSLMMNLIRKEYWIPRLKQVVKTYIHNCKVCFIQRKETLSQIMAPLPSERIMASRLFVNVGCDFAGPIILKLHKGRCRKTSKGYIALFVCFSTKAVHLEAVSDLSTKMFIHAFERFYTRRGLCQNIYTDNGGNFVGASRYFDAEYQNALKNATLAAATLYATRNVNFHFSAPASSHFNGLAEAGIKSTKHHLRRIVGKTLLDFEELATVLCHIEACLNSRPLTALSDDPSDLNALTPGHFITGDALLTPPEPAIENCSMNELKRLEHIQRIKAEFWERWKGEYLHRLQQRPKWLQIRKSIEVGDLVIIKNECTPPQYWPLARVKILHPSPSDGHVRVATLRTASGDIKRPIVKLCLLPFNKEADDSTII